MTKKLINTQKSSEAYWSLLKSFLNNKKIPLIPPLFDENRFITDVKEKAELSNSFFAKQCSLIRNDSELPTGLTFYTDNRQSTVSFSHHKDVGKIIQNLNPNKAHGHDNISIRMLKICRSTIYRLLEKNFKEALNTGLFPSEWKKGNILPFHQKGDKQVLKKYRLVSLLQICGTFFERLIFNEMFSFLIENNLALPNQSRFRSGDSCINQQLFITHEIVQSFDKRFEVRSVFVDISKVFDKVSHKGLIFKRNSISGNLLDILCDFLSNRKQRIVLNGQKSAWENFTARIQQGSILGPLLFLVYIKDLSGDLSSKAKLFANDTVFLMWRMT